VAAANLITRWFSLPERAEKSRFPASTLSHLKMQIKQRASRRADKPVVAAKSPEQSKNHVFYFAILSLKTERMRSFSDTWY
jgi:hypothetical protein